MSFFKRMTLAFIVFLCLSGLLKAQTDGRIKVKLYDSWVTVSNNPYPAKGILYEIKDTSILLSNSRVIKDYSNNNFRIAEINFKNIGVIKTRRTNSVAKGAIIGGTVMLAGASAAMFSEDFGDVPAFYYIVVGTGITFIGTGIGALIGSIKNIIPVNGNLRTYNESRARLQNFSYTAEPPFRVGSSESTAQHKSYIGMLIGPSLPIGNFADKSGSSTSGSATFGYVSDVINIAYRITSGFGVSASGSYGQYEVDDEIKGKWWGVSNLSLGPMFSLPVGDKMYFDIKPRLGFAGAQLLIDEDMIKDGSGLGINLNTSLLYNFSKRWCLLTETGYFFTHQKFVEGGSMNIQSLNLGVGIGYRFR